MKKLFYLVIIVFTVFSIVSCDDKEENTPAFVGMEGNYVKPHFEFEYPTDSITITMTQGKQTSFAVKDIKAMFMGMASEKMGAYFRGITFENDRNLTINMSMKDGGLDDLHARYIVTGEFIGVTLDSNEMKQLIGDKASMIPSISFQYILNGNQMTLFFDKVYIKTVYASMSDKIAAMIVSMMGNVPESIKPMAIEGVKKQISGILNNIIKLEIGFVLQLTPIPLTV